MRRRGPWLRILATLIVALVASCGDDENTASTNPEDEQIGGIYVNHKDPAALVSAHAAATSARDLEAYKALLVQPAAGVAGFRFYLKSSDANDLPWLDDDYWDYDIETTIMSHMFDSAYSSPEAAPIQSLSMELTVQSIDDQGNGTYVVVCTSLIFAMVGPDDGFASDTRFIFTIITGGDYLRIQSIEEIERQKGPRSDDPPDMENSSWGTVKSVYR